MGNPGVSHAVLTSLFLVAAGTVAGIIGTAGGTTSLAAYPELPAVGIPPASGPGGQISHQHRVSGCGNVSRRARRKVTRTILVAS